jgi:DNA repair protein RadC
MPKGYRIRDLPKVDRPRERLQRKGPEALSDSELLAVLLGSGMPGKNVLEVAEHLLRKFGGKGLFEASFDDLRQVPGIGEVKATQLIAAFELSKRVLLGQQEDAILVETPEDVYNLSKRIRSLKKEHFLAYLLDARNVVIAEETISVGTLTMALVHPREVFEPAVRHSAAGIVLVHNHPSGDPTPGDDDHRLTERLIQAGKLMGIEILDHVIVTQSEYTSLKELGWL